MTGNAAIGIVGAPSSAGAYAPGQEQAPQALRRTGLLTYLADHGVAVHDRGDTPSWRWAPDRASPRAQNVEAVTQTIDAVARAVEAGLRDGERVLVLGGDCTVGIGTMRALAALDPDCGLVYLDLHADMNTPASVVDGAIDWMGVAHMLQLEGTLPAIAAQALLRPCQVSLLGFDASQATPWEKEQVARLAIALTPVDAIAADPRRAADDALAGLAKGCKRIAVHFDVDIVDFVDAPLSENAGRNVGVPLAKALIALESLLADGRVAALTVAEVNPLHGAADGSTVRAFADGLGAAVVGWQAAGMLRKDAA